MKPEEIARVCHEANRAYCEVIRDQSQKSWDQAEQWQRDSAIKGVEFAINNPKAPLSSQHEAWLSEKLLNGWKYGPVKNPSKKEHPCCVAYEALPDQQKVKDALFRAVVSALS